ncbi:MAG: cadherin-like beta sandwich domain-containing protein [Nitrospira sp.]|nr:cadherin-like beta sandwich domain-containing protein [Nitrospira sp.]
MRRNHIYPGQRFVAVLISAIGLSAYGCKDSASISDEVQVPLSSLAVTPGDLQPAFSSNTTDYTVDAPTSATAVTVTAAPKDSTTTMTINGTPTSVGQGRSVPLGAPGTTTTVSIVLTSQTGQESTYTVTVTRLLSSDNNLSALTVEPGSLAPAFAAGTLSYTVNVATDVASVTASATKSDPNAVMSGSLTAGAGIATGQATIPLGGPGTATPVSIEVTAPNGNKKTYHITVNRLSGDNNLSALTVTPGSLTPAFVDPNHLTYAVDVATEVTEVTVSATKSDPNAVLSGSIADPGVGQATGQATIPLGGPGTSTPVIITVTAPNGNSKTYTLTVNRAAPSSDNNLSALTVTGGSLVPDFAPSTTAYTVGVPPSVASATVSATKSDSDAVLSGDVTAGTGVATGQATFLLVPLIPRTVSIIVTAPNGASKPYTITITRALL